MLGRGGVIERARFDRLAVDDHVFVVLKCVNDVGANGNVFRDQRVDDRVAFFFDLAVIDDDVDVDARLMRRDKGFGDGPRGERISRDADALLR